LDTSAGDTATHLVLLYPPWRLLHGPSEVHGCWGQKFSCHAFCYSSHTPRKRLISSQYTRGSPGTLFLVVSHTESGVDLLASNKLCTLLITVFALCAMLTSILATVLIASRATPLPSPPLILET
jgi:hypothetical protein